MTGHEHKQPHDHESHPAAAEHEGVVEIVPATDEERLERAEQGIHAQEEREQAKQDKVEEASRAVEALFDANETSPLTKGGNDVRRQEFGAEGLAEFRREVTTGNYAVDAYADFNGAIMVEDATGKQVRYENVAAARAALGIADKESGSTPKREDAGTETQHEDQADTVAFVEASIQRHTSAKTEQTPADTAENEAQVDNSEIDPDTISEEEAPYSEDDAYADLLAFGLSDRAVNLVLNAQHTFSKKERSAFLAPNITDNLFRRSGLEEDKRAGFSELLEKIHTGLLPPQTERKPDEKTTAPERRPEGKFQSKDTPELQQAVAMLDRQLRESLEEIRGNETLTDEIIGDAQELLRREITKLRRVDDPDRTLNIIAPAVERTISDVRQLIQAARSADERKQGSFADARAAFGRIAHDTSLSSEARQLAQQGMQELSGGHNEKTTETLRVATSMIDAASAKHFDDREALIDRLVRLSVKLNEAKRQGGGFGKSRQAEGLKLATDRLRAAS